MGEEGVLHDTIKDAQEVRIMDEGKKHAATPTSRDSAAANTTTETRPGKLSITRARARK